MVLFINCSQSGFIASETGLLQATVKNSKINPYIISFGMEPLEIIPRPVQKNQIIDNFQAEVPSVRTYMITGIRGSGKTVLMTGIGQELSKDDKWIVVELNPERDLLTGLASNLSSRTSLAKVFKSAKINLSFFWHGT